jgi:hypothetical protein
MWRLEVPILEQRERGALRSTDVIALIADGQDELVVCHGHVTAIRNPRAGPMLSFPPHSRERLREKPTPRDWSRWVARMSGEMARHTACAKNSGGGGMDGASLLVIRGIVGLIFGVVAFAWPGVTIAALVVIFGAYAIVDGVTNLVLGLTRTPTHGRSVATTLQGLVGIAAGVLTFMWPAVTALALVFFIGAWAIVTGVFEIAGCAR